MPSEFAELQLKNGRKIYADEVHMDRTYAGMLEGTPDDETNQFFLDALPRTMQRIFSNAPVYILPPEIERQTRPHPLRGSIEVASMPPIEIAMRFVSHASLTSEGHASQLVIVWHQHTANPMMTDNIRARLENLDWNAHAKDFQY